MLGFSHTCVTGTSLKPCYSAYHPPENGKNWKKEKHKHIVQLYKNIFFMFLPYAFFIFFILIFSDFLTFFNRFVKN